MATVAQDQDGIDDVHRSPLVGLLVAGVVSLPVWAIVIVAVLVV